MDYLTSHILLLILIVVAWKGERETAAEKSGWTRKGKDCENKKKNTSRERCRCYQLPLEFNNREDAPTPRHPPSSAFLLLYHFSLSHQRDLTFTFTRLPLAHHYGLQFAYCRQAQG